MTIEKWSRRFWAVYDNDGELICVTVYKKGAKEVVRRLSQLTSIKQLDDMSRLSKESSDSRQR